MTHYTTIKTALLILKNHKIRFNRLDRVDDISEKLAFKNQEIAKYTYISCWTNSPNENIALWNMYSKNMEGVCIELGKIPFKLYSYEFGIKNYKQLVKLSKQNSQMEITFIPYNCKKIEEKGIYEFQKTTLINGKILNCNIFSNINYEKDFFGKTISPFYTFGFDLMLKFEMKNNNMIGIKKHIDWSFQNESRYLIHMSFNTRNMAYIGDAGIISREDYINRSNELTIKYIDAKIDDEYFKKMKIVFGPKCKIDDKKRINEYIESEGLPIKTEDSIWTNKIN
jgi:hypothetical protein